MENNMRNCHAIVMGLSESKSDLSQKDLEILEGIGCFSCIVKKENERCLPLLDLEKKVGIDEIYKALTTTFKKTFLEMIKKNDSWNEYCKRVH